MRIPSRGFSLTELLVALVILGVISAFTLPKVLQSQQENSYKGIGKDTMLMIDGAFKNYQFNNSVTGSFVSTDLTPFMNYVRVESIIDVDDTYSTGTTLSCASYTCLKLHSGAILLMNNGIQLGGTYNTNAVYFYLDPDGKDTPGTNTGPGRSLVIFLYAGGRITDFGGIDSGTENGSYSYNPLPAWVPDWFR